MATDKKKPKKPPPKKEPKKKESSSKKNKKKLPSSPLIAAIEKNLLKICYFIAISDLIHALYFAVQATILLVVRFHLISSLALTGTIFWVLVVIILLVGLWKRRPPFVRAWILFSAVGFVMDILFLIWGITSSITVDWDHLQEFTIIFIGILVEFTCIYFIYRYYLQMEGSAVSKGAETGCCKSGGSNKSNKSTDRKKSGSEKKKPDDKKKAQEKKAKEKKKAQDKKTAEDKKKAAAKKKGKK
ncbi:uncharacterized protein LOC111071485 [Drosophila obscura]|uniref:uncharacterized protein LOC111071485 n=1 Tax=Drosophila obscura TaxID=7282 RepID=UPI001BB1F7D3|nr:uncharacterized protein LOC111071485 [Drosophila obscura]